MSNQHDVTIVPIKSSVFNREWITVTVVICAAMATWLFFWNQTESSTLDEPVYTIQEKLKELEVVFLDVGQGDCCFIRTPNGHTALIDSGANSGKYSRYDAGRQTVLPFLKRKGISRIDSLVMTHPHADHYGGMMSLLDSDIQIGEYLDPGMDHPTQLYRDLLGMILQRNIQYRETKAPGVLHWDPEILVQVLWPEAGFKPENPNNASIVLRIVYGDVVYMLTGDIEEPVESQLNAYGSALRTTVVKVPHHGSNTSSTRRFLENLTPRIAVISVGHNNRFNHPQKDVVELYDKLNVPVLRTDRTGTITTKTDGKVVRVSPELGASFDIFPFPPPAPDEAIRLDAVEETPKPKQSAKDGI